MKRSYLTLCITAGILLICSMVFAWPRIYIRSGSVAGGGSIVNTSWTDWTELTEAGWTGSGTSTFIVFFEGALGANETGQGGTGLAGVSRTIVQVGNVAAASGSPPKRALDHVDDYFKPYQGTWEGMIGNTGTWTFIAKLSGVTPAVLNDVFAYCRDLGDNYLKLYSTGNLAAYMKSGTSVMYDATETSASYPTSGNVYIVACSSASSNKSLIGWIQTKPTKSSDFAGVSRMVATKVTWPSGLNFNSRWGMFGDSMGGASVLPGSAYYVILSNECLIDLDS